MTTFKDLQLIEPLQRALAEQNYKTPTPIQLQAIPPLLEGRDVLGCAQTGTGKTAAFSLPVLQHLAQSPSERGKVHIRALILTPTRELAAQIGESLSNYGRHLKSRHFVIFGGVNENPQIKELRRGLDILVATPGRLLDLAGRQFVDLSHVDFFVLDEADRMLDMGFVHDVRRVMAMLPKQRQNLLFSATMPAAITKLADSFLHNPVSVEVTPQATTVEKIDQSVMFVDRADKKRLLSWLVEEDEVERGIVFTRTKHGANRLVEQLSKDKINAAAIHGNKSQSARNKALDGFRNGNVRLLVATDLASRGLDVEGVSHVFNYDLPNEPESYVHRIGRTARAGKSGTAISFCDQTEGDYLRDIEKLIGMKVPVDNDHDYHCQEAVPVPGKRSAPKPEPQRGRRPDRGGRPGGRPAGRSASRGPRSASAKSAGRAGNAPARTGGPAKAGTAPARSSARGPKKPQSATRSK